MELRYKDGTPIRKYNSPKLQAIEMENKNFTAVEYFDEQIQERIIAQDVVARKIIIEISMEDYINIKKQAKEMEKDQVEISDEEIYKEAEHKSKIFRGWTEYETSAWVMACQWYREQLKKR